MTDQNPNVERNPALAPAPRSAPTCEWWSGTTKRNFTACGKPGAWQCEIVSTRGKKSVWTLCDYHKQALLAAYNDAARAKETPEWKPNTKLRNAGPETQPETKAETGVS